MADEQKDRQADALDRLARGEGLEVDLPISSGSAQLGETAQNRSAPPPTNQPRVVRPPSPGTARPTIQASAVPAPQLTASQSKIRPAAPVRPPAPKERPAEPPQITPPPAPAASEQLELSSALANVVEDSDAVFAPAPDVSVLARAKPRLSTRRTPYVKTLHFRRTIIPVLLMLGVSLPALAIYWLTIDKDSLLRSTGAALPIVLASVGAVMLALAILNMIVVKQELQHAALTAKSVSP
jgi:hypothetical protein